MPHDASQSGVPKFVDVCVVHSGHVGGPTSKFGSAINCVPGVQFGEGVGDGVGVAAGVGVGVRVGVGVGVTVGVGVGVAAGVGVGVELPPAMFTAAKASTRP